ncbi:MAG TPA: DUF86 domain-containing protein [Armatimonadota bacterium]|jgi:uncharacterized protein with HEPN domain
MPRKEDFHRLYHIWEAATEALDFVEGRSRMELDENRMLQHTLIRLLEIIGEAAGRVSEPFRDTYPEIPWSAMIGMRNRMIHAYFDINLNIVWDTVVDRLPGLINVIAPLLRKEGLISTPDNGQ